MSWFRNKPKAKKPEELEPVPLSPFVRHRWQHHL